MTRARIEIASLYERLRNRFSISQFWALNFPIHISDKVILTTDIDKYFKQHYIKSDDWGSFVGGSTINKSANTVPSGKRWHVRGIVFERYGTNPDNYFDSVYYHETATTRTPIYGEIADADFPKVLTCGNDIPFIIMEEGHYLQIKSDGYGVNATGFKSHVICDEESVF